MPDTRPLHEVAGDAQVSAEALALELQGLAVLAKQEPLISVEEWQALKAARDFTATMAQLLALVASKARTGAHHG